MTQTSKPAIEVTLNPEALFERWDEEEGRTTLADDVVNRASHLLLTKVSSDDYRPLRERVADIRDAVIREKVEPLIEEALTKSVQPTDAFGEPKGQPVTLREVIVKTTTEYLRKPKDSYGSSKNPVQEFIRAEVEHAFKTELNKVVAAAKAEVLAAVKAQAADVITETVARMANVR